MGVDKSRMGFKYVRVSDVKGLIPRRRRDSRKGDNGRLLVLGGSSRYVGAPALTALAALRTGVDLATVAAPFETARIINSFAPDLITIKLPCENLEPKVLRELDPELERCDAVVVGPGLGTLDRTLKAITSFLKRVREHHLPVLVDADGVKAVVGEPDVLEGTEVVLTPHAGEFKLLGGEEVSNDLGKRVKQVSELAKRLGCVILLKGWTDVISSPQGRVIVNRTGNPGMTVGGTGDVLSGVVGALLAQGVKAFEAAWGGAFINGMAGDMCMRERGYGFTASDLIEKIPDVLRSLRR